MTPRVTRRDFLATGTGVAVAGALGLRPVRAGEPGGDDKSRVVLIRSRDALDEAGQPRATALEKMLDEAVAALLDEREPAAAWRRLVRSDDVVGIKSNVWRYLPTPPELEAAIRARVLAVGVAAKDIAVDDRGVRSNPVFERATALVNVRPMRTHHWSGLGTCLKNHIMFVPRPAAYHADACATLGAIWKLPEIAGKTRLNVLVMLTPQFHGVGPHSFSSAYTWRYGGLIVGTDPVAVDATGARIIQARRDEHFGELSPISPPPHHIELAGTRYGLGNSDAARIELIRLGWQEHALI